MKIYSIGYDSKYDCTIDVDCDDDARRKFTRQFNGKETDSYVEKWNPPPCYHLDGEPGIATFTLCYHTLSFAFYDAILEDKVFIKLLETYGEILPVACSDSERTVYQYHCMNCIGSNADYIEHQEKELWRALVDPEKMAFRKSQIPDRGLFWLSPNTTHLYTVENEELGVEHNFKMLYDARGYTGLVFTEIKLI